MFLLRYVEFVGHTVYGDGIRVDIQRIEEVKSSPRPTPPTDIMIFLGLDSYYIRFLRGFPIFHLLLPS